MTCFPQPRWQPPVCLCRGLCRGLGLFCSWAQSQEAAQGSRPGSAGAALGPGTGSACVFPRWEHRHGFSPALELTEDLLLGAAVPGPPVPGAGGEQGAAPAAAKSPLMDGSEAFLPKLALVFVGYK